MNERCVDPDPTSGQILNSQNRQVQPQPTHQYVEFK